MKKRVLLLMSVVLLIGLSAGAQQAAGPQPLTVWNEYTVKPGKEADFMNLVKTVGAPVRDKLMAEGVIEAWGVDVPVLRRPDGGTHWIWYSVRDWASVGTVQTAMQAQLEKLAAEDAKPGRRGMTTAERIRDVFDMAKTKDWLTRDVIFAATSKMPPAGVLPYTRYFFAKVKPGKGYEYRRYWEKYNKPVLDKLVAEGVVLAYGLAVEEVKTTGDFTHFSWMSTADLTAADQVRAAFVADRERRTQEERDAINEAFASLTDADAARQDVSRSVIFKLAQPKQ